MMALISANASEIFARWWNRFGSIILQSLGAGGRVTFMKNIVQDIRPESEIVEQYFRT
jgi:hypothetical protein